MSLPKLGRELCLLYWASYFVLLQFCSINREYVGGQSIFLGWVETCEADLGIQIFKDMDSEEKFDIIFSIKWIKKLAEQLNKLQFDAIPMINSHVEMIDKEWVSVTPTSPNSYELRCSIYSFLNSCSTGKVCVMEVTE